MAIFHLLFICGGFQVFCQGVELCFPEGAVLRDPGGRVFHGLGREPAVVHAAVDFALEQSRRFEDAQMF
ncbi:MAG TPA: hypothetical protein VHF01_13245 [Candidatus Acidoferrum sp.]|nr:hypothetical protein [Candidatus Acidoferrum sp.]